MSDKQIWILFTKSKPLPGCPVNMGGGNYYFAGLCIPLDSKFATTELGGIIESAKLALSEMRLELVDVSKCIRYVEDEWQEPTPMNEAIHALAKQAMDSGAVTIGGFRSEEIENDCRYLHVAVELDV